MTATVLESSTEQAAALCGIARFAARAGLPLPTALVVSIPGDDASALALLHGAERRLREAGANYAREDTDLMHRLVVHAGGGVTYRLIHARKPEGSGS